ncbi:MAG TPA: NAD(P)/FAD-dependent oxidoreductase [Nitrospirota bacterium]|nr:NAD(P)/FAD-dependent oxidoreductase [Nitrospirota bacterium]
MTEKSIIIIGGGIAGLAAGCYGRMNGFRTRIYELHKKKPGGLCTAWKRQGYTINGCLHWLIGSGPGSKFHMIWRELGALEGMKIVDFEEYGRFESIADGTLIIPTDMDRFEKRLIEIAPQDRLLIREFISAVRVCMRVELPVDKAPEVMGLFDIIKMIFKNFPFLRIIRKWNKISLKEYGDRFKHPLIRKAFPELFLPDFPVTFMLMSFAWMHKKSAGYPVGGSLEFSRSIEKRYLGLGGEMHYKSRVAKILTEHGRAVGIKLDDGTEHRADYVISAADGHATIFDMLEGKYIDDRIRGYYEKLLLFPPLVYIAIGVNRTFRGLPSSAGGIAVELEEPLLVGGVEQRCLGVHIYNFDPTLAPEGKTVIVVMFQTDFEYWKKLRENDEQYKAEKEKLADTVVNLLDRRFPGLAAQVEMRDVASPTTFVRYTNNWKGSFEGWQVTPKTWSIGKVMKKTLPGLDNFYMAGQWVEPGGGLPAVALSGRNAIQIICKKERKKFTTMVP